MQEQQSNNKTFLPLVISASVCVGILIGFSVSTYQFASGNVQSASKKYRNIFQLIEKEYADTVDIDDLFNRSIKKTLQELDPHSSYIPKQDLIAKTGLDSEISGIGIKYIYLRDSLFVSEVIKNGPAYRAGLRAGDRILIVDGTSLSNLKDQNTFASLIRGDKNTNVKIAIYRKFNNKTFELNIERNDIPFEAVDLSYMIDKITGYIKLNRFSESSGDELHKQLQLLKKQGMKQLILDLRDNGGGYYDAAVQICDEFLPQGRDIVYTQSRGVVNGKEKSKVIGEFEHQKLVVLINESSASASEIVASALQDNDRAVIVGRRSFGKALVQTPFSLFDGSEVRITTARYYSPSGRCLQKPYSLTQNYSNDLRDRQKSGEFFNEDKIFKNDSLKYHTRNNRTVYGGGGVYPDIFVSADTSLNHSVLAKMIAESYFLEFTILQTLENEALLKMDLNNYAYSYIISNKMMDDYLNFCRSNGMKITNNQWIKISPIVKRELKIFLAEAIWGANGMYRMVNLNDPYILKSLEVFPKSDKILSGTN